MSCVIDAVEEEGLSVQVCQWISIEREVTRGSGLPPIEQREWCERRVVERLNLGQMQNKGAIRPNQPRQDVKCLICDTNSVDTSLLPSVCGW